LKFEIFLGPEVAGLSSSSFRAGSALSLLRFSSALKFEVFFSTFFSKKLLQMNLHSKLDKKLPRSDTFGGTINITLANLIVRLVGIEARTPIRI
jgi:hypothetical protein